jgi:hypothetical protein
MVGAPPGFPVGLGGIAELHAAFLTESRTREHGWRRVQEIRVAPSFSSHVRQGERGAPSVTRPSSVVDRLVRACSMIRSPAGGLISEGAD